MVETSQTRPRRAALEKDWIEGSVLHNLLRLSWPMVVMESLWVVSQIVDMVWVGRLGSSALAGMGLANVVLNLVYSVDMGLIVGVRATIARYVGAGDVRGANHVAGQGVLLGLVWGALVTLAGSFLAGPVLRLFGADAVVVPRGDGLHADHACGLGRLRGNGNGPVRDP